MATLHECFVGGRHPVCGLSATGRQEACRTQTDRRENVVQRSIVRYIGVVFIEVKSADFGLIRRLYAGHKQYVPALAVIEGAFPGRVFVDNIREPKTAIVWAIGRWAYIESTSDSDDIGGSLVDLIDHTIKPDSLYMNMNWFELYARNSPNWIAKLDHWLSVLELRRHFESLYVWDRSRYRQFRSCYSFPEGSVIEIADAPILNPKTAVALSVSEEYRSRTALGCRVKVTDKVVAQCRSNGFCSGDEFMIDVITLETYDRGKGYATAAAVGLLDCCVDKKATPLWETTEDNVASRRLAQKLGFIENEIYPVYAIEF